MGRAVSVNLDDALPLEPAQQFPIGPAMPIKVPSGPPPPESSSADSAMARATSGASAVSNPSNNAYVRSNLIHVFSLGTVSGNRHDPLPCFILALAQSCAGKSDGGLSLIPKSIALRQWAWRMLHVIITGMMLVQGAAAPDDFERALRDLRAKAATERAAAAPPRPSPAAAPGAPAASAAPNGGASAFSAFSAAAAMPLSSDSSDNSSARVSRGSAARDHGAAAARAGPGPGTAAPAEPAAGGSPPFSPMQAAAAASAFTQQQLRPITGPKNYDLLLGD